MIRRKRGVMLIELLAVLLIVGIGGSLITVGLASVLRSQKRVAEFSNRYTLLNDFLSRLSVDTRRATTASVQGGDGNEVQQVLLIGEAPRQVSYRFFKRHVERTGFAGDVVSAQRWDPMVAVVKVSGDDMREGGTLVHVTVSWHRSGADVPDPDRRFDVIVRCAGELGDVVE